MRRVLASAITLALIFLAGQLFRKSIRESRESRFEVTAEPAAIVLGNPVRLVQKGAPRPARITLDGGAAGDGSPTRERGTSSFVLDPKNLLPGVHVASWGVSYLGDVHRSASFGYIVGPFGEPGGVVPCSARLAIDGEIIHELAGTLKAAIRKQLDRNKELGTVKQVTVQPTLSSRGLDIAVKVALEGGSELRAFVPLRMISSKRQALLFSLRAPVRANAKGKLRTLAAVKGGGIGDFFETVFKKGSFRKAKEAAYEAGEKEITKSVAQQVKRILPALNSRLAQAIPRSIEIPLFDHPIAVELTPCGSPLVSSRGITVRFNATVPLFHKPDEPPKSTTVPGPVQTWGHPLENEGTATRGGIELTVSEDLVNAIVDSAWRSGKFARVVDEKQALARANRALIDVADLRVEALGLDLPPVVLLTRGRIDIKIAETRLSLRTGDGAELPVVLSTEGSIAINSNPETLDYEVKIDPPVASCEDPFEENSATRVRRPCPGALEESFTDLFVERGKLRGKIPFAEIRQAIPRLELTSLLIERGSINLRGRLSEIAK